MTSGTEETFREKVLADAAVWARGWGLGLTLRGFLRLLLLEPGFQLTFCVRLTELVAHVPGFGRILRRLVWYPTTMLFGCDFGVGVQIGGGLYLPHPFGIVVNADCKLGRNVTLLQGVTLGIIDPSQPACPILEDGARVNAGAKLLGGITVGRSAVVGANAVVLRDVPAGRVAVGVPARILPEKVAPMTVSAVAP
ncbi:MAG TPA: serine acetyltransferase [Polyangiaceae bacterium]|jgi:serine O-acetyltransferase|nr:serine acetyltransferase [Polyangiaceae bacterium]